MPEEIQNIIDSVRSRLQAEIEAQLGAVAEQHQQALVEARRAGEQDAEGRQSARVRAAEEDAERRSREAIATLRSELERQHLDESAKIRAEADQRVTESSTRVRHDLERALTSEREQARIRAEDERRRAEDDRRRADEQLSEARAALDAERLTAAASSVAPAAGPSPDQLMSGLRALDAATTVSDTLAALTLAAAAQAPRVALFIANGEQLDEWAVAGVPALTHDSIRIDDPSAGVVGVAVRDRMSARDAAGRAPAFSGLPHGRATIAIPLLLDRQPVGVLYGDEGAPSSLSTPAPADGTWQDALEVIATHGATRLGYLTAVRTAQAMGWISRAAPARATAPETLPPPSSSEDEEQSAKRYARLLVSEIKLYNEAAVRIGRQKRDLLQRLDPEIDRARRLYEERVPTTVSGRAQHFHHELVHTLAGGDASLLS